MNDECGVFGIFSAQIQEEIGYNTYLGLCSLQHRGEESCGIAINNAGFITCKKDVGLVSEVFRKDEIHDFVGNAAIGQVKYSGSAAKKENALPLVIRFSSGNMALVYNGSLINSMALKKELQKAGVIFQSSSDAEVICSLICRERIKQKNTEDAIISVMKKLKGAYAFVVMTKRKMIAVRDPHGLKPLVLGKLNNSTIFASETCALDMMGATYERDIKPGEVYCISAEKSTSKICDLKPNYALCIFEYIYFARPDSCIEGIEVHDFREETGKYLAQNDNVKADVVCGVPDSGIDAALGYSKASKVPYNLAFIKNKYVGRTFIKPNQNQRESLVHIKLSALKSSVKNKKIILVDDSIVRGTTMQSIIKLLKNAGAKEVHVRISSPKFINICPFNNDIKKRDSLIANQLSTEEIRKEIVADSLAFLKIEDLHKITQTRKLPGYCAGCFTGTYPMKVPDEIEKDIYEN